MGIDRKFSIDNQYELDELKNFIGSVSDRMRVTISFSELDDKKPFFELNGTLTKDEVSKFVTERKNALHSLSQKDELTGVLNDAYFAKRLATIDRSQALPVDVVNININDWKFVNDNFGDEESDRLIKTVANIIMEEAEPYFVIGRIDGDVFGVVIPMAREGEAEFFINNVKKRCDEYEDPILAPSVAAGMKTKTNIEEKLEELLSDAEYDMFNDKYEIKNSPGYRERLTHGITEEE